MIPASVRLLPPSPNANISPPTTIAISDSPRAIGPVNYAWSSFTASTHGLVPCAQSRPGESNHSAAQAAARTVLNKGDYIP